MNKYSLNEPFVTKIVDRKLLSKDPQLNKVYFISLDIENSDFVYDVGDSIGIIPQNDPRIIDLTIKEMKANKDNVIIHPKKNIKMPLYDFLLTEANISKTPTSLLKKFDEKIKPDKIKELLTSHHLWDLLKKYPKHKLSAQEIVDKLLPMLPRLYSVASSIKTHPNRINLLVAHVSYELSHIKRNGVCTEFLCHLAKENLTKIRLYSKEPQNFKLANSDIPIIMIGPGMGLAPFISFLEERIKTNASNKNWLFFGGKTSKDCFYFEDFLKNLEKENKLKLTTAFSRDQKDKIYVQNKIYENRKEFIKWLDNNAVIYICGDAYQMARDVEKTLLNIFMEEKNISPEEAEKYLEELRQNNRYLKDVY
ncbi:MAG: Sulfite reductase [NADPH] flavoprotein alpha-component [Candidatus Anoxychlamydiales bacterium]|nr:Sulfite reductase [NADPH] flavoprotein alpha-component [Candidatus Anoxychlamydiales bacterium]